MAVCGVVPVAAIVPVFSFIVHIPALYRDHIAVSCYVVALPA